jgi:hypothetical protein
MRHALFLGFALALVGGCTDPDPIAVLDAGPDVKDARDDVKTDGPGPDASKGCPPGEVSSFSPTWVAPKPASASCSPAAIDQYAKDCLDPQTRSTSACTAFQNANKACVACLVTPESSSSYGASILRSNGVISLNVGGCIALLSGDLGATGCGGKYEASRQCSATACDACPIPEGDDAAFQAYLKCLSDAEKTVCKSYAGAVCPAPDAGAVAACELDGATFVDNFKKLAPLFCAAGG